MAKGIADKIDLGAITCLIGEEEENIIREIVSQHPNMLMPNYVTDIYKLRRGRYKNVKIWSRVDLSTCTIEDIFITDGRYRPIEDFELLVDSFTNFSIPTHTVTKENERKEAEVEVPKRKLTLQDF